MVENKKKNRYCFLYGNFANKNNRESAEILSFMSIFVLHFTNFDSKMKTSVNFSQGFFMLSEILALIVLIKLKVLKF